MRDRWTHVGVWICFGRCAACHNLAGQRGSWLRGGATGDLLIQHSNGVTELVPFLVTNLSADRARIESAASASTPLMNFVAEISGPGAGGGGGPGGGSDKPPIRQYSVDPVNPGAAQGGEIFGFSTDMPYLAAGVLDINSAGGGDTQATPVLLWPVVFCASMLALTRINAEVQCRASSVKTLTYGTCGIDAKIECVTPPEPPEPPAGGGGGGGGGHTGGGIYTFGGFSYGTPSGTVNVLPIQQY